MVKSCLGTKDQESMDAIREVRLAQLETLAVIHPVRIRHHKNHLKHIIARREVVIKQCQLWQSSRRRLTCGMPVGGVAFQEKLVTCRDELTLCRVQKTARSVSCRCTLKCARAAKSLPWRKNMMKQAAFHGTSTANEQQKLFEKTLKHQAEVDVESHVEEEEAAEVKNHVQHSNIEQPIH